MKAKNILKIGVFSIVILSLLISPILISKVPEAEANGNIYGQGGVMSIKEQLFETSGEDICPGVGSWQAQFWQKAWWEHLFCVIQKGTIEALGKMFAAMINTQVKMIIWAFSPATYGGFVKNSAVQEVWNFIRDLINLVLVLALVFIAITTILGMKKYSWQQTLWKLVVVALLVNFSLVMAGMILDVSHFLAYTFLNLAKMNSATIADSMIKSFEVETLNSEKAYELSGVTSVTKATTTGWGLSWGNFLIASFGLILIGLFALIALLAVFVAMIVRSFIIVALLCFSPIAFAAWIFPDTAKYWKMWWDQFIKWCTFPIIFGLMLWIGVKVVDNLGNLGSSADLGMIPFIIRMFLFSMFLVGGLIFSIQGGGAVAQTVTKQAGKLGLAAGAFAGTKIKGKMVESPTYKKAGQALTKVPLLKGVGEEMMVAGEKAKATRVKENEKNLENISLGTLKQLEKAPLPSPLDRNAYERRVALTNKLADMGEMSKESIEFTKIHKGDIRFKKDAIAQAVPHYFKIDEKGQLIETGKSIKEKVEALARIKPDKIRDKTQDSDFIKSIVKDRKKRAYDVALSRGKTEEQASEFADNIENSSFNKTIQEIFKTLSPAQSAGFYQGLSPKDLIEEKWGGPEGKIVQAIEKDEQTKKRFYEELLPLSSVLRASSGIKAEKEQKQGKGPKETPTSPPPGPGWVFKNGLWRKE